MTEEQRFNIVNDLNDKALSVMSSKAEDYATADILSNFKRLSDVARIMNINIGTPAGYALFMVLLKIDRISNLLSSDKEPNNESVADSFIDGRNYLDLAYMCYVEKIQENDEQKGT